MPETTSNRKIAALEKELKAFQQQMEKLPRRCEQEMERLQKRYDREIEKVAKNTDELGLLEVQTCTVNSSVLKKIEAK